MSDKPVVEVEDLWYAYHPNAWVLRGVDLRIFPGEFVALIGQNGAGKTSLVKNFNGILHPTKGSVRVLGRETQKIPYDQMAKYVGYAYQNPDHQIFNLTVRDELAFGPRQLGLSPAEIDSRVAAVLATVELTNYASEYPFALGRGERQKLAVGAILTMQPAVVIIDEPTTGMDWKGGIAMMDLIADLHRQGQTIVMITHDMRIVASYARRVIVMADGEILADGGPREVFSQPALLAKADLQPPQITRIAQALASYGVPADVLTVDEALASLQRVWSEA